MASAAQREHKPLTVRRRRCQSDADTALGKEVQLVAHAGDYPADALLNALLGFDQLCTAGVKTASTPSETALFIVRFGVDAA